MTELKEPVLFGAGLSANEDKAAEYDRILEQRMRSEREEKYLRSGVPEKFLGSSFESFIAGTDEEAGVKSAVMEFSREPRNRIMILCGNNGNGKTHLGCSVIRELGGEYVTSSMLCLKYDSAVGYRAEMSREQIIEHYMRVSMLVVDDCGKFFLNKDLEKFILVQVVCGRYENNRPTVLITNAEKKSFVNFLGKAVYDRLTEVCTTVEFAFDSKRYKGRRIQ